MEIVINDTKKVKEQYANANGINARITIHEKYSTNKLGLGNWYFTYYQVEEGMKILELGCGPAGMWLNHKDVLEKCSEVVLSDFSEGMLEKAKANLGDIPNVTFRTIDIQDIPYEDECFDIVIANFMLYHVPDIDKALSEVKRVLKKGGQFYAGTVGKNGVMETVSKWVGDEDYYINTFSLDNGEEQLRRHFNNVRIERYIDSLEVTDIDELMDYIYSGITFKNNCTQPREEVRKVLEKHRENGVIKLPKDPGMFVVVKD